MSDKFGDQGIVGVLLAVPADDGLWLRIESYLVSCRALGRGVEEFLWAELARQALDHKVHGVIGEYIPTPKNGLARGFYDKLGFARVEESASMTQYLMEPLKPVASGLVGKQRRTMNVETDRLRDLLIEFFELSPDTTASDIVQERIAKWDSLAMVQLIVELQTVFGVEFEVDEIDRLTSYSQIGEALGRKGVKVSR